MELAKKLFRAMCRNDVEMEVAAIFHYLAEGVSEWEGQRPCTSKDYKRDPETPYAAWALDAMKGVGAMMPNFTGMNQIKSLVQIFGECL